MNLNQLEDLFVEKLSEKYKLTERDLKRAFAKYDKDNSGTLNVAELTNAISLYLNGVDRTLVAQLVQRYDIDGDGVISVPEFCQFLQSRNATSRENWMTVDHLTSPAPKSRAPNRAPLVTEPDLISSPVEDTSYHARLFLSNIKAALMQQAVAYRNSRTQPMRERLQYGTADYTEKIAMRLLMKACEPYLRDGWLPRAAFEKVVSRLLSAGGGLPSPVVVDSAFRIVAADADLQYCSPDVLVEVIFDKPRVDTNQFGFTTQTRAITDTGRPLVGPGPINYSPGNPLTLQSLPLRFNTSKCRTSLAAPSNLSIAMVDRSAHAPNIDMYRDHVFGLKSRVHAGNSLFRHPTDNKKLIYAAAALGVVHDTEAQIYFEGHDDDITCITVCGDLVATGQLGQRPVICVWNIHEVTEGNSDGLIARVGDGFIHRAVCAVSLSYDGAYVFGIGCDDHHAIGVWGVRTGELVASAASHNGTPPQITSLTYAPAAQFTGYINKEYKGECDLLCSTGVRHLKFWSFKRPDTTPASLHCCTSKMGKVKVDKPKTFFASAYQLTSSNMLSGSNYNIIAGGSCNYLFYFSQGVCIQTIDVFNTVAVNSIFQITVIQQTVYCSGSKGLIKTVTGQQVNSYSLLPQKERPSSGNIISHASPAASRPVSRSKSKKGASSIQFKEPPPPIAEGVAATTDVLGMCVAGAGRYVEILGVTGFGKVQKLVIGRPEAEVTTLLTFHYGPVYCALPVPPPQHRLLLSGGDDKWLCCWDIATRQLAARLRTQAPIRCVDICNGFVAIGQASGLVSVAYLSSNTPTTSTFQRGAPVIGLLDLHTRKDSVEDIADVKFSPNCKMLAAGSHDNYIYIYLLNITLPDNNNAVNCKMKPIRQLRGHSSYITHLDWSVTNKYIRSNCGAYEILYWDVLEGKQVLSSYDTVEADTEWHTSSCVLGFNVMGIWDRDSDGTDINSVDASKDMVVIGDDFGQVSLMNYPCVVNHAPRKIYTGHSSHVMSVKFTTDGVVSAGGSDSTVMLWKCCR